MAEKAKHQAPGPLLPLPGLLLPLPGLPPAGGVPAPATDKKDLSDSEDDHDLEAFMKGGPFWDEGYGLELHRTDDAKVFRIVVPDTWRRDIKPMMSLAEVRAIETPSGYLSSMPLELLLPFCAHLNLLSGIYDDKVAWRRTNWSANILSRDGKTASVCCISEEEFQVLVLLVALTKPHLAYQLGLEELQPSDDDTQKDCREALILDPGIDLSSQEILKNHKLVFDIEYRYLTARLGGVPPPRGTVVRHQHNEYADCGTCISTGEKLVPLEHDSYEAGHLPRAFKCPFEFPINYWKDVLSSRVWPDFDKIWPLKPTLGKHGDESYLTWSDGKTNYKLIIPLVKQESFFIQGDLPGVILPRSTLPNGNKIRCLFVSPHMTEEYLRSLIANPRTTYRPVDDTTIKMKRHWGEPPSYKEIEAAVNANQDKVGRFPVTDTYAIYIYSPTLPLP